jgi:hypothetical protein
MNAEEVQKRQWYNLIDLQRSANMQVTDNCMSTTVNELCSMYSETQCVLQTERIRHLHWSVCSACPQPKDWSVRVCKADNDCFAHMQMALVVL